MQKVILDLLPGGVAPIVYASQYDDGRSIRFMLTEGGPDNQYILNAGDVITCNLTKPDGTETVINVANPGGGEHYVDLVNGADDYDQAGAYLGEIVLTRNTRVIGSANFVLKVEEDAYGGQITTSTATGNPCTFTTDLADALVSLAADIVCGGGNGSPDNPIPIVGYSELNLTRCGANFTDISDNTISGAGYVIGGFPVAINTDNLVLPSGNYVFSFNLTGATYPCACQLIWYRNGVEVGNTVATINASGINAIAFTASGEFDSLVMFCNSSSGGAFTNFNLNIGSTPSDYAPYNGTPFIVQFGQTVYGGVCDKSGRLTITHGYIKLDGTQPINITNWRTKANSTGWIYPYDITNHKVVENIVEPNLISNCLETKTYYSLFNDDISGIGCYSDTQLGLVVRTNDTTLTNATAINNYLSQNPIEVCYELATPIVIDVPSISVSSENGTNNIISDCGGDVSVTYIKKV